MTLTYTLKTVRIACTVSDSPSAPVTDSPDAVAILRAIYADLDAGQEHLVMLARDAGGRITGFKVVASGGSTSSIVDPKLVFRAALFLGADAIILAHNHPSGTTTPSAEDVLVTRRLALAGEALGIRVLDHIILGDGQTYYSFAEDRKL